ncbi:TIGR02117 family protein [Octadecabacter sp. CECT 8868]|uniref:TIGR02117 family protein n=1 Tax=Octadecabacter algicola TaxID=2909342 RepID=UPI001F47A46E|nr:TIGR02117 family protein [Octadecabacter algicola]MCF2904876.1 TIGR02117 family protein [Octadecabacter algicola]
MIWLRRLFRAVTWALVPFILYFGVALLGAFAPQSPRAGVGDAPTDREIILVAGLIHYDILLPVDDATLTNFGFLENAGVPLRHPLVRWLAVGWGSEAFYTTTGSYSSLSASTVLKAATGDVGVMRFEVTGALPVHPRLRRIRVSEAQLTALRASILSDLNATRTALPLSGFTQTDVFFPAAGRFNVLRTCNVWISDKLADAGLTIGAWTPTPYAVTVSLWWNGLLER